MRTFTIVFFLLITQAWGKWSVSTYNIRNFDRDSGGATDHAELISIIESNRSDVMTFQEVVNLEAFKRLIGKALPGHRIHLSRCGGMGKQALAVVYNPNVFSFVSETEDLSFSNTSGKACGSLRPLFLVTLLHTASSENYVFGVAHLKAGSDSKSMARRWQQYVKLNEVAKQFNGRNLILTGDFNTTGYNIQNADFDKFEQFLGKAKMSSLSKDLGCSSYWHGGRGTEEHWPSLLDHVLIQDSIALEVKEVKLGGHCAEQECRPAIPYDLGVSYESVSDHCPIQVTFK